MPSKKKDRDSGIHIGGNAYTSGGDIAGGDITKGNVYQNSKISISEVNNLFQSIYNQIDQSKISSRNRGELKKSVQEIQEEVSKGKAIDESFLEKRLNNIARMAPDILEVVVSTLANPAIGLGVIAKKIAEKANQGSEKEVKKNE